MPRYFVNRSAGWPLDPYAHSRFDYGQEFESESREASEAADAGYLIEIADPSAALPPKPVTSTHSFDPHPSDSDKE